MNAHEYEDEVIARLVAAAPPLSQAQEQGLRSLLAASQLDAEPLPAPVRHTRTP